MTKVECVPVDKRGLPPAAAEAASSEAAGDVSKEVRAAPLSHKQPVSTPHDESCECPPGAWHLRSCDVVWWPEHMREDSE